MDKHPDKYFSSKLGNFRQEPPAPAWDRIDANLSRGKTPYVWLRIAAGFLLLIAAGSLFFILQPNKTEISFKDTKHTTQEILPKEFQQPGTDTSKQILQVESHAAKAVTKIKDLVHVSKTGSKLKPVAEEKFAAPIANFSSDVDESEVQSNSSSPSVAIAEEPEQPKVPSRVITFSAEEVNKKYLRVKKKESIVFLLFLYD